MIDGGEDPKFIARRLVIFASEDVGNADPYAITLAVSVFQAVSMIGLPEARINLAQGVTYLASCAKSNAAYAGINEALAESKLLQNLSIPMHLRNAPTKLMKRQATVPTTAIPTPFPVILWRNTISPKGWSQKHITARLKRGVRNFLLIGSVLFGRTVTETSL